MSEERYPTQILKDKFIPLRDISESPYNIELTGDEVMKLVDKGKVMYALMKDPIGNKRIPHINIEQLSDYITGGSDE